MVNYIRVKQLPLQPASQYVELQNANSACLLLPGATDLKRLPHLDQQKTFD